MRVDLRLDPVEACRVRDLLGEELGERRLQEAVGADLEERRDAQEHLQVRAPVPAHPLGERLRRDADQACGLPTAKVVEPEKPPQILAERRQSLPPTLS